MNASGARPPWRRLFTVSLPVTIRKCREEDLSALEWFGRFSDHREIIQQAYRRQEEGENVMLIADADGAPVGQAWVDLVRKKASATGVLWAVRVFPWLRSLGIGSRLVASAEDLLRQYDFAYAELGVETDNPDARRFYERLGYELVDTRTDAYSYTTPEGEAVRVPLDKWVLRKQLETE